jgi:hypothetical protein
MFRRATGLLFLLLLLQVQARPLHAQDFRIGGTVLDARSMLPLPRAEVSITSAGAGNATAASTLQTIADAEGRFLFTNLSPGKYSLSARCRGYVEQNLQQHESYSTAIAVGKDLDSENVKFLLVPSALIVGQVTNEFGEPVRDAQVMLFKESIANGKQSIRKQNQASTDDQGRYRLSGLQRGRYYVAVSAQPWYARHPTPQPRVATGSVFVVNSFSSLQERNTALDVTYPITYYPGAIDSARASAVTLQPGETAVADFALQPVPALHLRITSPGTDLSHGFQVDILQHTFDDVAPSRAQVVTTDKDFIDVGNLPAGPLTVNLLAVPNGREPGGALPRAVHVAQQDFEGGQTTEINMNQAAALADLSGTVQAPPRVRLPQGAVIVLHETHSGAMSVSAISPEGNFDFSGSALQPGTYVLSLSGDSGLFVNRVQATGAKVSGRNVELRGAEPVRLSVELSLGLGSVSGIALLDGKPAPGAMILLIPRDATPNASSSASAEKIPAVPLDPLLMQRDQSDSDGTFALARVVPGQYILLAISDGWDKEWADPSVLKQWISGGQIIQVAPNRESSVKVLVQ